MFFLPGSGTVRFVTFHEELSFPNSWESILTKNLGVVKGHDMLSPCWFSTPLKFNVEPEKKSLEKEVPLGNHHFQVPC